MLVCVPSSSHQILEGISKGKQAILTLFLWDVLFFVYFL